MNIAVLSGGRTPERDVLLPMGAAAAGMSLADLCDAITRSALDRRV